MDEPDWAKILRYLNNHNGEIRAGVEYTQESEDLPTKTDHEEALYEYLRGELDWEKKDISDISDAVDHLRNTGLVALQRDPAWATLQLAQDGFHVDHERQLSNRGDRINQSLVFFTFVLVVVQSIDVAPVGEIAKVIAILVTLIGMVWALLRTDVLV